MQVQSLRSLEIRASLPTPPNKKRRISLGSITFVSSDDTDSQYRETEVINNCNFISDSNWLNTPQNNTLSTKDSNEEIFGSLEEDSTIISSEDNTSESEDTDLIILDSNIHNLSASSGVILLDEQKSFNLLQNKIDLNSMEENIQFCDSNLDTASSNAEFSNTDLQKAKKLADAVRIRPLTTQELKVN